MLLITREVDLYNQTSSILQCKCYFLYALPINDMMVQAICQFIHSAHSANTVLVPNACRYYVSNTRALKHCGTVTFFRKIKIFFKKQYIILLLLDIQNVPKARYNIYFSLIATFLPTITSEKILGILEAIQHCHGAILSILCQFFANSLDSVKF